MVVAGLIRVRVDPRRALATGQRDAGRLPGNERAGLGRFTARRKAKAHRDAPALARGLGRPERPVLALCDVDDGLALVDLADRRLDGRNSGLLREASEDARHVLLAR